MREEPVEGLPFKRRVSEAGFYRGPRGVKSGV